ncbi:hypothetical protein ACFPMF_22920 [Larkinella bovis]|uniref:Uncharacterized protein n=1 Tax=Larkinella bovis TaxID=683041 RepID=A0ABW0IFH9_9BACT
MKPPLPMVFKPIPASKKDPLGLTGLPEEWQAPLLAGSLVWFKRQPWPYLIDVAVLLGVAFLLYLIERYSGMWLSVN